MPTLAEEFAQSDEIAGVAPSTTASLFEKFSSRLDPAIHPRDLSSGQQLALVLAIQLVKDAPVVLLDEPTRGLDYAAKKQVAQVLRQLAAKQKTLIFASHDVEFIAQTADRVIELSAGRIISDLPVEQALGYRPDNILASQVAQITKLDGVIALQQVVTDE
jgi:energy-coupling factor transport system ATP-binding protein